MALNPFKLFPSSPSPHFLDGTIGTYRNAALRKWKNTWLRKKRGMAWRVCRPSLWLRDVQAIGLTSSYSLKSIQAFYTFLYSLY